MPATTGVTFDFSGLSARLQTLRATDPAAALIDAIELVKYAGKQLHPMGWDGVEIAAQWVTEARNNSAMASVLAEMRVRGMEWTNNADLSSWFQSTSSSNVNADMVWGSENPDVIYGGDGVDAAQGGGGDDLILGGAGNDGGLDGNDGNDIIDGGAGDDYMVDSNGDDLYMFGRGYGQDRLQMHAGSVGENAIQLRAGIGEQDVRLHRAQTPGNPYSVPDDNNVYLALVDSSDRITFQNWFGAGASPLVSSIRFSNGAIWNHTDIQSRIGAATAGNDTLLLGGHNNDAFGRGGNDLIDGGAGDDRLFGDDGSDTLTVC